MTVKLFNSGMFLGFKIQKRRNYYAFEKDVTVNLFANHDPTFPPNMVKSDLHYQLQIHGYHLGFQQACNNKNKFCLEWN